MGEKKIDQIVDKLLKRNDDDQPQYSILVVSDDSEYLPYLCNIIESEGHQAHCGTGVQEALDLLEEIELPDLLIVDFVHPERDASELLKKARIRFGKSTTPPVLFLQDTPEDEEAAHELYADDVLLKPLEPETLLSRVRKLGKKQANTNAPAN